MCWCMNEVLMLFFFGENGWGDIIVFGVMVIVLFVVVILFFGFLLGFLIVLVKKFSEFSLCMVVNIYMIIFCGLLEFLILFFVYFGV